MGDGTSSLSAPSLLLLLLLASTASPSFCSNISAATFSPYNNHSRGLIADDLGLEYLIDSPHVHGRLLAETSSVTGATADPNNPAGCGRTTAGQPYRPCTPQQNPQPTCRSIYDRTCQ